MQLLDLRVWSLLIEKSSQRFNFSLRVSLLTFVVLLDCSISVNFASFMKLREFILFGTLELLSVSTFTYFNFHVGLGVQQSCYAQKTCNF